MRTTAIAVGLLATLLAATPAFAQDTTEPGSSSPAPPSGTSSAPPSPEPTPAWLTLSAYSGHAAEKVAVAAACFDRFGPLTTQALRVTQPLAANAEGHQPWALFAETVIRDVPEGSYPVSFDCGGEPVTVHFTVLQRRPDTTPGTGQTRTVPRGAPETGDGSLAP